MQKYQNNDAKPYMPPRIPWGASALAILVFACDGELTKRPRPRKAPAKAATPRRKAAPVPVPVGISDEP